MWQPFDKADLAQLIRNTCQTDNGEIPFTSVTQPQQP